MWWNSVHLHKWCPYMDTVLCTLNKAVVAVFSSSIQNQNHKQKQFVNNAYWNQYCPCTSGHNTYTRYIDTWLDNTDNGNRFEKMYMNEHKGNIQLYVRQFVVCSFLLVISYNGTFLFTLWVNALFPFLWSKTVEWYILATERIVKSLTHISKSPMKKYSSVVINCLNCTQYYPSGMFPHNVGHISKPQNSLLICPLLL